jgi:hypothetical protein
MPLGNLKTGATGPPNKAGAASSEQPSRESVLKEIAKVIADLHQLLQSYSPAWYTEEMDARMRKALAEANSALAASKTGTTDHAA